MPGKGSDRATTAEQSPDICETIMRKQKPCTIGGVAYPSRSEAACALGLTKQRICQLVTQHNRQRKTETTFRKPIMIEGTQFGSIAAAARALGMSYWATRYAVKRCGRPRRAQVSDDPQQGDRIGNRPPMRNAVRIIQRTIDVLVASTWVSRLPISQRREIAEALDILQAKPTRCRPSR